MTEQDSRIAQLKSSMAARACGTRAKYVAARCRCMLCRAANSRYQTERDRAKREDGDDRHLVDATAARQHIRALSGKGIGYKSVAATASVSIGIMAKIVSGVRKQVRHDTEQRILAVTAQSAIGDGTLVSAADSWRLLDRLLARGYTRGQLASFLGYKTKALQIKRGGCITGRTKVKVERLYARVEAGLLRRDGDVPRADLRVEQRSALAEAAR